MKKYKRCWRGKLGRNKFQNRSKWIAKKKHDREELARRKATRIQSMVRGRKERRTQRSRRDKKNAAVRLQAYARGRKDRLIKIPKLKENARKILLLEMAAWRSDPRNNLQTLLMYTETVRRAMQLLHTQIGGKRPATTHGDLIHSANTEMKTIHLLQNQKIFEKENKLKNVNDSNLLFKNISQNQPQLIVPHQQTTQTHNVPHARQAVIFVSMNATSTIEKLSIQLTMNRCITQLKTFCDGGAMYGQKLKKLKF